MKILAEGHLLSQRVGPAVPSFERTTSLIWNKPQAQRTLGFVDATSNCEVGIPFC